MKLPITITSIALLAACTGPSAPPAASPQQTRSWVPIIVKQLGDGELAPPVLVVQRLGIALRRHGVDLMYTEHAARRLEQAHSSPPSPPAKDADLAALDEQLRSGADTKQALDDAQEALDAFATTRAGLLDPARRSPAVARAMFDFCLQRATYEEGADRTAAIAATVGCIADAPTLTPNPELTSPRTLQLYRQARQHLLDRGSSKVRVALLEQGQGDCLVTLNGLPEGPPPFEATELPSTALRVTVDCDGKPGRTHQLAPGDNTLVVDPRFEQVVSTGSLGQSDKHLSLRYDNAEQRRKWQLADGARLATLLRSPELLMVEQLGADQLLARRVDADTRAVLAEVVLDADATTSEIVRAAKALASGQSGRVTLVTSR